MSTCARQAAAGHAVVTDRCPSQAAAHELLAPRRCRASACPPPTCLPPLQVVSDPNGAFTRFLGMEQGAPDASGARSLRYAAVVDDGVLLKVVRACCNG